MKALLLHNDSDDEMVNIPTAIAPTVISTTTFGVTSINSQGNHESLPMLEDATQEGLEQREAALGFEIERVGQELTATGLVQSPS
jgi:hypothetical protein